MKKKHAGRIKRRASGLIPPKKSKKEHYFILYKPYGVLCQFTDRSGRKTLSDFGQFPLDVYPAGRLDFDSEGLVLLTNDGRLKEGLLNPENRHPRTYLVQVENIPDESALNRLRAGIRLKDKITLPAGVHLIKNEPDIPERDVPIRYRKNMATAWLRIILHEGRNRQVRKMTAAVGCPTLRLIRVAICNITIGNLQPGEIRALSGVEIQNIKNIINRSQTVALPKKIQFCRAR